MCVHLLEKYIPRVERHGFKYGGGLLKDMATKGSLPTPLKWKAEDFAKKRKIGCNAN